MRNYAILIVIIPATSGGILVLNKRIYRMSLIALSGFLLLLDKSLMIFELRSKWNADPRVAMIVGSVLVLAAILLIARAPED